MKITPPSKPLSDPYVPSGGVPHKVSDTDTLAGLARQCQVDVWWLIQYNFETRDPAEVNWYLKHRFKCTRTTADGQNFRFSATDKPGILYLPTAATARPLRGLSYGKFGIRIGGDEDYQLQVRTTLDWISRSDTGMVLLEAIGRTGKAVLITPWSGAECNATAGADDWEDATQADTPVFSKGFKTAKQWNPLKALLDLPQEEWTGTGAGSDVTVSFSPTMWGYGSSGPCAGFAGKPGTSPSQVLFHELAHAYRQARGLYYRRPTIGSSSGYTDLEEFFAVALSNVMIADPTSGTGNRTLRADHSGFQPLAPTLCTSHGFLSASANRNLMRELVASDPYIVGKLKGVNSPFNPFAEPM